MSTWQERLAARSMRPELPGAELEPFPYISGYGLLIRLTRLTAIEPCDMFATLGIRMRQGLGLMAAVHRRGLSQSRFEASMGLETTGITQFWTEEAWSPLQLEGAFDRSEHSVRNCPTCARYGYHCVLFQLPSIAHCPWHGLPLSHSCACCGNPTRAHFDPDGYLGRCDCGHDPFDDRAGSIHMWDFPTGAAETWLSEYLSWVSNQRQSRHLVVPETDSHHWLPAYAALAQPPPRLTALPVLTQTLVCDVDAALEDPAERAFWGWSLLGADRPLSLLPLPPSVHHALSEATQLVVAELPAGTLTPLELVTTHGLTEDVPLCDNIVNRPDCFILPHGLSTNGNSWINVSAVDPETLNMCGRLLDLVARKFGPEADPTLDRSWHAVRSQAIDTVTGRARLHLALQRLLTRGYAQGLDAILRSQLGVPRLCGDTWLQPVLEIVGRHGALDSVRIVWVPVSRPTLRRAVDVSLTLPPMKLRSGRRASKRRKRPDRQRMK